jgi:hypothetical protein
MLDYAVNADGIVGSVERLHLQVQWRHALFEETEARELISRLFGTAEKAYLVVLTRLRPRSCFRP